MYSKINTIIFGLFCVFSNAQLLPANRYYNPDVMGALIWDNTAGNSQVDNGSGTWNSTNTTWLQTATSANQAWIPGGNAIFGGNLGNGAAGTITVSGTQDVKSMFFNATPSGNFLIQSGNLNLLGGIITTNQDATISSTLQGGGNFIKKGLSNLILTGNNTFSGSITVSEGGLYLGTSTAIGTTNVILGDSGTGNSDIEWRWAGGFTPSNNIVVSGQGTGQVLIGAYSSGLYTIHSGNININRDITFYDASNDRSSFTGLISGTTNFLTIDGLGTWNPTTGQVARVTFDNTANTFVATIRILAGKAFQMNSSGSINKNKIEVNGNLVLNVGANNTAIIGALDGASTGICEIHSTVAGPQTFSIGNDNGNGIYNGIFRNGLGGRVVNVLKTGTGTQLLNGTSTHTGTTTVNNGILGGTGTFSNTSSTTVSGTGILQGGTGTGNAGTLNVRNLNFTSSTSGINVYSNGTTLSQINVTGTCNFGTASKINLMQAMPTGTFTIISSSGTMSGTNPTIGTNLSGRTATITKVGNTLRVTLT